MSRLSATQHINRVTFIGAFNAFFEFEVESAGVEAEPPGVGFVTGEARAVDAGLLAGAEADDWGVWLGFGCLGAEGLGGDTLAVQGVADGVGLCIFESDCCDCEVSQCGIGKGRGIFWCDY